MQSILKKRHRNNRVENIFLFEYSISQLEQTNQFLIRHKCFSPLLLFPHIHTSPCFISVTIVIATRHQYIETEQILFVDQFVHSCFVVLLVLYHHHRRRHRLDLEEEKKDSSSSPFIHRSRFFVFNHILDPIQRFLFECFLLLDF